MLMPRRLESHLNVKHVPYSMIFHAPTNRAQMAARAMHLPGKEVAKAVALEAGDRKLLAVLPASYRRISHGDEISIGARRFKVITGGGHALDQVMLYCAADKLFLSADQVLSKISPNVSVWAVEPDQNSLGEYLASLASLTTTLPYDVMVLPGHGVPFYGLKTRIKQLADHHEDRCRLIAEACREVPQTSKELVPVVFHKHVLDAHQMGFAAGELIAHVNYMLVEGRLNSEVTDGVLRFSTT